MEIRPYSDSDRSEVVELWKTVFPGSTGHNDPEAAIDRKVAVADSLFLVAVDADTVVGTVMCGYDGHRGWIYSVAVDPGFRRRGIGTQLMERAEHSLADLGCPKINLQTLSGNAEVVGFYRHLGFTTEERISMGKLIH